VCGRSPAEDLPHTFAPRPFTPSYRAKKRLCTVKKARKALPECCPRPPLSFSVSSFFVVYNSTIAQNWQGYLCTFYILSGSIAPQNKTVVQSAQLQVNKEHIICTIFLDLSSALQAYSAGFGKYFRKNSHTV